MPHELPPLPYAHDALEPTIDAQTMEIHHGKHHQAYVDNLNKALEGTDLGGPPRRGRVQNLDAIPEDKRAAVRNNGGGHANHSLFWTIMKPKRRRRPVGRARGGDQRDLRRPRRSSRREMNDAGVKRFGSGWTWLVGRRRRPRGDLDAEPGQPADGGQDADPRHRRLGARLLPQVPEPAPGLPRRLVGRRRTGTRSARRYEARAAELRTARRAERTSRESELARRVSDPVERGWPLRLAIA